MESDPEASTTWDKFCWPARSEREHPTRRTAERRTGSQGLSETTEGSGRQAKGSSVRPVREAVRARHEGRGGGDDKREDKGEHTHVGCPRGKSKVSLSVGWIDGVVRFN